MLSSTDAERRGVIDYVEAQDPRSKVAFVQKLYSERLDAGTHDVWDIHTRRGRWWVVTNPMNLYSQKQFPNMDLALTFHIGLCVRMPRAERSDPADRAVQPLLACWRAFDLIAPALGAAQEVEDYHAIGVRCRECLLSLVHSIQDGSDLRVQYPDLKRSDFVGWVEAIAAVVLAGPSQQPRRNLARTAAKSTWEFVNWLTHSRSAHFHDAEAALGATEQVLNLLTTGFIRYIRGVPDACPACGSQRLAPERGRHGSQLDRVYERTACAACHWTGKPIEILAATAPRPSSPPEGDCVTMDVPLRSTEVPSVGTRVRDVSVSVGAVAVRRARRPRRSTKA